MTGVLVNTIQQTSSCAAVIKKGDVLMEFDHVPIANDGTVHLRQRERIYFTSLITLKPTGERAHLKASRLFSTPPSPPPHRKKYYNYKRPHSLLASLLFLHL